MNTAFSLLFGLRRHDLRAARTFINTMLPGASFLLRLGEFLVRALGQIFIAIPKALKTACFAHPVSRTPIWLAAGNPLANQPWAKNSRRRLPCQRRCSRHRRRLSPGPAAPMVVMGRYFAMVRDTVRPYLTRSVADLSAQQRAVLAEQFAARYSQS